jgi:hypothetical protein
MKQVIVFVISFVSLMASCGNPEEPSPSPTPPPAAPVLLAELQVWHGLDSHRYPPYDSRDPAVIARQIDRAAAGGIAGFVVDWYGPADGAANDDERRFQDEATAALFAGAETKHFKVALLYDEGTVSRAGVGAGDYQTRVVSDLEYARKYIASPAYLQKDGTPLLFVFPYDDVEPHVSWKDVRDTFASTVALIDKDPDPLDASDHDAQFAGFFAWVTATNGNWDPDGAERGEAYLNWFYATMLGAGYSGKIMVGGAWPGFDDALAPWRNPLRPRYMARRGRESYDWSMELARQNEAPYILIETWNDFEEGTDVEYGVEPIVDLDDSSAAQLIRSAPFRVDWSAAHVNPVLQVYKNGNPVPIYDQTQTPGVWLGLKSVENDGDYYELKLWAADLPAPGFIARSVVVRHQDPVPGVTPVIVDE